MTKDEIKARIIHNAKLTGKEAFPYTTMGAAFVAAALA